MKNDPSRSQVTITLSRTRQVVQRAGAVFDADFIHTVRIKPPITDTLVTNVDNKRQLGVYGGLSFKGSNNGDDTHLSKHDLRFKIKKQTQQKTVDLRDMLSRKVRRSSTDNRTDRSLPESRSSRQRAHQLTPEPGTSRQRAPQLTPEPMNITRCIPEPNNDQWRVPEKMGEKQPMLEPRDGRRLMGDTFEVGPLMPNLYNDREHIIDPMNRVPSLRTSKTLSRMDLSGNSFSLSTLDQIRPRSRNRVLDNVEHLTVESFLHSLGLDKYLISFKVEEVDMAALSHMGEHDLKEIG